MGCVKFFSADIMYYHIPPLHPILSATGLCTQNIAQCFVPTMKEFTINEYTEGSLSLCRKNGEQNPNLYMTSFDIQSLFTNIALEK